ncbi:MAG: hypothetical protein JOZ31_04215 [Verrucomicrobia bacterium]|nr:hypothetical protein [Verrucomicrobiota bacterium]MBV8486113.1 hypothetical protein [Verrucomicrobiota bacterium]
MKPFSRFFRFHLFLGVSWMHAAVGVFAAEKPASPESPGAKQLDPGWPREVTRNGIRFVYYQPQVDEWKDFRELRARLAFVLTPKDGKPAVGVEELKGRTTANVETRTVLIDDIEITAVRFPALSDDEETKMEELLKSTFPGKPLTVSLDRLITSVQASQEKAKTVPVKTDPPTIMISTEPAVLLTVQGDSVLGPIKGIDLKFVLNANWDLFFDSAASKYYLLVDKLWLSANSLDGPWSGVSKLPADFSNFPAEVLASVPGTPECEDAILLAQVPVSAVVKRTEAGSKVKVEYNNEPQFAPIEGASLSYATNTRADVIKVEDQYYLCSD